MRKIVDVSNFPNPTRDARYDALSRPQFVGMEGGEANVTLVYRDSGACDSIIVNGSTTLTCTVDALERVVSVGGKSLTYVDPPSCC